MPTTKSLYADVDIPDTDLYSFIFSLRKRSFPDDKIIYRDAVTDRFYTFTDVRNAALDFGKGLRSIWDWKKGDVLALFTPNCIDTPPVMWGVHWAGGIVSPANPGYTAEELAYQLRDSGARALVTQLPFLDVARAAAKEAGIAMDKVILIGDERDPTGRAKHFTSIRSTAGSSRYKQVKVDPKKDLAFLVYSSGTTGTPKGVRLSHHNIVANVSQNEGFEVKNFTWEKDKVLAILPFFHIYGLTAILIQVCYMGLECVVVPKFDIEAFCQLVQKHKITFANVAPPVIVHLSKHPVCSKYDLSSIRMLNSGAAPLTRELVEAVHARLGLKVKQGYGLSETSPTTHAQLWTDWRTAVGSVGKLFPNMEARYMTSSSEDGASDGLKEVPVGEVGELHVRGPNIFQGYHNRPEETAECLSEDGWFRTGDVGYQDKDGNFFITDRVKELIKYKGFQVPPAELEGVLLDNPLVDDVAVIGVYDDEQGTEVPRAYVVCSRSPKPRDAEEIMSWLAGKVANHKRLRGGVKFVDEIPKSPSGKILRRKLKAEAQKESEKVKAKL